MATRIGVVLNPRSKRNLDDPGKDGRLRRIVGDRGAVLRTTRIEQLDDVARELRAQAVDVVAVAGGDGTTSSTLTALRRVWGADGLPAIALLRGGSMNTVANSLGLPRGRTEALLSRLVARAGSSETLPTVTRVTLDVGGRLGFLLGTGAMHGFMAEYYSRGRPYPTPATALETLVVGAASTMVRGQVVRRIVRPIRAALTVDGERWGTERDYFAVAAGTVEQIGLGFRPFHRANEHLDAFHVLGIHCTPLEFVRSLPRIHRARPMRPEHVREAIARALVVEADGGVPHMLDGDLHEAPSPLGVSVGPTVRIVVDPGWIPPLRPVRPRARFELWRWLTAR